LKDICIIAPMLNSLDGLDEFIKKTNQIGKDKYNFFIKIFHVDEVPKKYNKNKNLQFVLVEYSDTFDTCVTKGFENVDADAVVIFDIEDANAYQNLTNSLAKFENGAEIVLTKRKKDTENIFAKFFRIIYSRVLSLAKLDNELYANSNFGLFSKRASNIIASFPQKNYYLRNFDCFIDYNVEFLDYQKPKRKSKSNLFNIYFAMFMSSFALSIASLLLLIFGINSVYQNNQAFFTMIGITIIFAGILFGLYNFYIWFLQRRTHMSL